MREKWARNIALFTGVLVLLLAVIFAMIQNPPKPPASNVGEATSRPPPEVSLTGADMDRQVLITKGRSVYEAQSCGACHSIAGDGNPRNPLDGVGERRTKEELRQWVLASGEVKDQLPAMAYQVKQAYRNQTPEDLDALIAYLQSLRHNPDKQKSDGVLPATQPVK